MHETADLGPLIAGFAVVFVLYLFFMVIGCDRHD